MYIIIIIKTCTIVPSGVPQNILVTAVNATCLFIQWNPIHPTMANGLVTSYSVNVIEVESNSTVGSWSIDGLNTTIKYLHPYYHYKVYVAGSTVIGTGPYTESEGQTHPAG